MAAKGSGADTPLPQTCTASELAGILGMNRRNLQDWAARGVLVRVGTKYATVPSIQAYINALREQAAGRSTGSGALADEKARIAAADRELKELKLAMLKGDALTREEVSTSWAAFAGQVKAAVLGIPSKARSVIPHLTAHDGQTLKTLCRDILTDLAKEVGATVVGGDPRSLRDGK